MRNIVQIFQRPTGTTNLLIILLSNWPTVANGAPPSRAGMWLMLLPALATNLPQILTLPWHLPCSNLIGRARSCWPLVGQLPTRRTPDEAWWHCTATASTTQDRQWWFYYQENKCIILANIYRATTYKFKNLFFSGWYTFSFFQHRPHLISW